MRVRYEFRVQAGSWPELAGAARLRAEQLFGCPASDEAFVRFDVREFVSSMAAGPIVYEADVDVEMDLS